MSTLEFSLQFRPAPFGRPEERAGRAEISLRHNDEELLEHEDRLAQTLLQRPILSSYHLAYWLAWNYWRILHDPRPSSPDLNWRDAHEMNAIGDGYIWPPLALHSDGALVYLDASRSTDDPAASIRYLQTGRRQVEVSVAAVALDRMIETVIARLRACGIEGSALQQLWAAMLIERSDPQTRLFRRLEALLGCDQDAGPEAQIQIWLDDASQVGAAATEELAASSSSDTAPVHLADLQALARTHGMTADTAVPLASGNNWQVSRSEEAWRPASALAREIRRHQQVHSDHIADAQLEGWLGLQDRTLVDGMAGGGFAFDLERAGERRVVLRSNRHDNRRFAAARLLGDALAFPSQGLRSATEAPRWRQKFQRAFAAELLAPIAVVREFFGKRITEDRISDAAEHFGVSERAIDSILRNNHLLPRGEPAY